MNKNNVIPAKAGIQKNVGAALLPSIVTGSRIRCSALPRWYGMTMLLFLLFIAVPAHAETAYERVMKTGVIRCGYILWPPFMDRDVNTGKFKGLNYDYMEALAKSLDLKVEWTMEIIVGQIDPIRTGKVDAICSAEGPVQPNTTRHLIYTRPIALFPFFLYTRIDDARKNISAINTPDTRIVAIDGDVSGYIASTHFPQAKRVAVPQGVSAGQMMLDVITNKADVVINDPLSMAEFFKNNPGKLKKMEMAQPVAVIPLTLSVLRPEGRELADLLTQGMNNMQNYGMDEAIFKRYEAQYAGEVFYRPAPPYKTP